MFGDPDFDDREEILLDGVNENDEDDEH